MVAKNPSSLPANPHEAPIYGHLGKSITPFISPSISPITLPLFIEAMKIFMGEKGEIWER